MASPRKRPVTKSTAKISTQTAAKKMQAFELNNVHSRTFQPALTEPWTPVVLFDDEYLPAEHTQVGPITYTLDGTDARIGNKRTDLILSDGNDITFTGFTIVKSDLAVTVDTVTPEAGKKYLIQFTRAGAVSRVVIISVQAVSGDFWPLTGTAAFLADVIINQSGNALTINDTGGGLNLNTTNGGIFLTETAFGGIFIRTQGGGGVFIDDVSGGGGVFIRDTNSGGGISISTNGASGGDIKVTDARPVPIGILMNADYSATMGDLGVPPKIYVDTKVAKAVLDATIPFSTVIQSLAGGIGFMDLFVMSGPFAMTSDVTNAEPHVGETRHITGDGNDITVTATTGTVNGKASDVIPTVAGQLARIYSFFDGRTMTVVNLDAEGAPAGTPPILLAASVSNANPNDLILVYSQTVNLTNLGYTFRVDTVNRTLSAVSGSGTATITFTISGLAIVFSEVLDISYDSGTGDTIGVVNSLEVVSFNQTNVINNVGAAPTIVSQSVEDGSPNDLVVVFNEAVTATNLGYAFRVDAVGRTLSAISGSGTNTLTFTISGAAIVDGEVLDLSYVGASGDTLSVSSSQELEDFNQTSVTNNIVLGIPTDSQELELLFSNNYNDTSTSGNGGTPTNNGTTFVNDRDAVANSAANFDRDTSDQYITLVGETIDLSGDFAFSFWFNGQSGDFTTATFFDKRDAGGDGFRMFHKNGTDGIEISFNSDTFLTTQKTFNTPQWYHLIANFDISGNLTIYIDDVLDSTHDISSSGAISVTTDMRIGARNFTSPVSLMRGDIDDFRVYSRLLTAQERTLLFEE